MRRCWLCIAMPVNPATEAPKQGRAASHGTSPTRPFTPDQSDELLFQPEPRGSARTKVTADHTFSTVPGKYQSYLGIVSGALKSSVQSSHIIPDSTRFIIALGPVWRGPSSFSTQSGCEPWITVKQGEVSFRLPRQDPDDPTPHNETPPAGLQSSTWSRVVNVMSGDLSSKTKQLSLRCHQI